MFKKINFRGLNYKDLDRYGSHDLKRDEIHSFYQTFDFLELIKKWPEIVGPKMSPVTSPLKIKYDSLFIVTKHAIFSQELSFLSEEIKGEIYKVFPELKKIVKKLVFQTQEGFFQERIKEGTTTEIPANRLHPQSPIYKLRKQEADRLFQEIEDEELKKVLTSLYIQSR
ncbi:MAG TPA: DUF721 domain-containing protein [Bacteriovoracaceae bacterium]|nr:DUF721 domain-containing protein [Bacteriovoracaceae bacterium]